MGAKAVDRPAKSAIGGEFAYASSPKTSKWGIDQVAHIARNAPRNNRMDPRTEARLTNSTIGRDVPICIRPRCARRTCVDSVSLAALLVSDPDWAKTTGAEQSLQWVESEAAGAIIRPVTIRTWAHAVELLLQQR